MAQMLNSHFELILESVEDGKYKATTPLFPKCKGKGLTKDEAIEKLVSSITYHIAKSSKFFLKNVLHSDSYSEVITDPSQKDVFQHRVINLEDASKSTENVFLKMMSKESLLNSVGKTMSSLDVKDTADSTQIISVNICLN